MRPANTASLGGNVMRLVRSIQVSLLAPRSRAVILALFLAVLPIPASATFHFIEINKILTSYNGDATIQAVELRMMSGAQNLVSGVSIRSYDAAGILLATHGAFTGNLPVGGAVADRKVLCATTNFATQFGITPDLTITSGLPLGTGQVSFETGVCLVNAVAYGAVTVPKNGTTSGPAIPSGLAYVLTRTVNNSTLFSCPHAEDAAARFVVRSGSSGSTVAFANNAGTTVNVFSTVTAVGGSPITRAAPRAYPNPFQGSVRIESSSPGWIGVFDVRGSLVRVVSATGTAGSTFRGEWDGRDARGRNVPAGVYLIRFGREPGAPVSRVALLR